VGIIESMYTHDFGISRPVRTSNGTGGWAVGYADAGEIRGRLRPASAAEQISALQRQARVSHVLYCAATADVRRGDLASGAGQVVKVIDVREPSHAGHHLEVDCVEIQKEGEEEEGS
jgi:head-tail adaptor